jgi:hypothetical protein
MAIIMLTVALPAGAVVPTRITLSAPAFVEIGEDISIEARLTTLDGLPLTGRTLTLYQVGAVGQRVMARETTDEKGVAWFLHNEFTVPFLALRVVFAGDGQYGSSQADVRVEVRGIKVPPSVPMSHSPSPLTKAVLFTILGAVWLTYAYAGTCIVRIIREGGR